MACIEKYIADAENVLQDVQECRRLAEEKIYVEFIAARNIQRLFRGYITRKHIMYLNKCATVIQCHWRGILGRKLYIQTLKEHMRQMYQEYYDAKATIIQKVWRGHYIRENVFNYYKLKSFILSVLQANKQKVEEMKKFSAFVEMERRNQLEEECLQWVAYIMFKLHHLLSTHTCDGIYSYKILKQCTYSEKLMKLPGLKNYIDSFAEHKEGEETNENVSYKTENLEEHQEAWNLCNNHRLFSLFPIKKHVIPTKYIKTGHCHDNLKFSCIEKLMNCFEFKDYMAMKREKRQLQTAKDLKNESDYFFTGRLRECEEAWLCRNEPGKYSLFATGEYGADDKQYKEEEKLINEVLQYQEKPITFGLDQCKIAGINGIKDTLDWKEYSCPLFHRKINKQSK